MWQSRILRCLAIFLSVLTTMFNSLFGEGEREGGLTLLQDGSRSLLCLALNMTFGNFA